MFDVGFSEVLLIAIVALLVLGPERLPKAARFAGLWIRRARGQWDSVRNELERELAAEELKASVERARREAADIARGMQETEARVQQQAKALEAGIHTAVAVESVTPASDAPADAPATDGQAAAVVEAGRAISLEGPLPVAAGAQPTAIAATAAQEKPHD